MAFSARFRLRGSEKKKEKNRDDITNYVLAQREIDKGDRHMHEKNGVVERDRLARTQLQV